MTIKQIFILAAGRGERMRPLTDSIPKPLVKIAGISMLDRIIQKVSLLTKIEKIIINAYYLSEMIETHLEVLNNHKIKISKETEKLETGGGLLQAMQFFNPNEPILLINSDIVWQDQNNEVLNKIINSFDVSKDTILLGLKPKEEFLGYHARGDFNFEDGKLNKPELYESLSHVFVGIQIIHPKILQNHPKPPFSMNYFYQDLKNVKGVELPGKFFHVGDVASIAETEKYFNYILN